jgi:hypothetical protein
VFVELDSRRDAGYTVSLVCDRNSGETQIVVADSGASSLLVLPRPRRERRRSVPPSLQVRAVSANDHGVATRVVEPDAPAAAGGAGAGHAATFASTEHFSLQTARALTVSESNGRANVYLAALSSNLIALAFIGQMSRLGVAFYAFALILLPVLAFVGTVTFVRLVQSSVEDIAYAHRIGLVRSYDLRVSPELEPYLVVLRARRRPRCMEHRAHGN